MKIITIDSEESRGEYFEDVYKKGKLEVFDTFFIKFISLFCLKRQPIEFQHMNNKEKFIDISRFDLISVIILITIALTCILSMVSNYQINNYYEKKYQQVHYWNERYDSYEWLLDTDVPGYKKQVSLCIPEKDMSIIHKFLIGKRKHYSTHTNYVKVVDSRRGYCLDISPEDFKKARYEHKAELLKNKQYENTKKD